MDIPNKKIQETVRRLQIVRLSLLQKQPFYALLLLNMKMALDQTCSTAYTDGQRIAFNPDFLDKISDNELEYILMHEALHAALGHPFRRQSDYDLKCYDMACDIVVNSNILYSFDMDLSRITLKNFGVAMHKTPSGKEGYECTVEEVYYELIDIYGKASKKKKTKISATLDGEEFDDEQDSQADPDSDDEAREAEKTEDAEGEDDDGDAEDKDGEQDGEDEDGGDGEDGDGGGVDSNSIGDGIGDGIGQEGKGKGKGKGEGKGKGKGEGKGKGVGKGSTGMGIAGGKGEKWQDPNDYDLDALLSSIKQKNAVLSQKYQKELIETKKSTCEQLTELIDDHSFWDGDDPDNIQRTNWQNIAMQSTQLTMEKEHAHKGYGGPPACAVRMFKELTSPEVDWKTVLNEFIQEEVCDYSFSPPDKRMDDCPFFLPDFNEKDEKIKNVWFLIDTSGSIGDKQIAAAYSEIISAIEMFDGKMEGLLSFTEVFVSDPIPFCSIEELLEIKPVGGGGNDFGEIFRYMQRNMMDELPTSIVIMTDGYDYYPEESEALGVPVFWLINNEDAQEPPWGKWARFKVNDDVPK